jgi:hypothetical protein
MEVFLLDSFQTMTKANLLEVFPLNHTHPQAAAGLKMPKAKRQIDSIISYTGTSLRSNRLEEDRA